MWDNGIGMSEMVMIAVIALVVFGPEKFPEYAKIFLRAMKDLRGYVDEVKTDLAKEINPLRKELQDLNRQDPEKLLDAMTGGAISAVKVDEPAAAPAAAQTPAPAGETSDTPESDADNDPYQRKPMVTGEMPPEGGGPQPYAENQDFGYNKPPERLD